MARLTCIIVAVIAFVALLVAHTSADDEAKHKKVVIHVPFKVHTVHHHHVKKIPVYHYHEDHDHHHHHYHHGKNHDHHHFEEDDDGHHGYGGWH